MTDAQREALTRLCERYHAEFDEERFTPQFDLPDGYVAGWVRPPRWVMVGDHAELNAGIGNIYVGCSPEGEISS